MSTPTRSSTKPRRVRPADPAGTRCPRCAGEFFWYMENQHTPPELLCTGCVRFTVPACDLAAPFFIRTADVPGPVQMLRPSERAVYRILRDRADREPMRADEILKELERRTGEFQSRTTVGHALTRLRDAGLVRTSKPGGWAVRESRQPTGPQR